jgi:FKBP-type peptidyl-prolyl cis-trans isomerase SlyD
MRIRTGSIVSIEYVVTTNDGEVVEKTDDGAPVQYLHGAGMLLPSLEQELEDQPEGKLSFFIKPENAYGLHDESNVITLPKTVFPRGLDTSIGARLAARTQSGDTYPLTVVEDKGNSLVVDLNHPLAGKELFFTVDIKSVRPAGNEEIFSGHPRSVELV